MRTHSLLFAFALATAACTVVTTTNNPAPDSGAQDAGGDDASDGAASETGTDAGGNPDAPYPAFPSELEQVTTSGGAVIAAPKIVTVAWTADPNMAAVEAFDDAIGPSAFWKATTGEYGVGAGTPGGHVEIATAPPASITDAALEQMIQMNVDGAPGSGWPAPDANTIYLVFVPEATQLLSSPKNTDACLTLAGYHGEVAGMSSAHIVYGVVAEKCHGSMMTAIENATETAAHELVEAATDPHVQTDAAYAGFDSPHYAWELWNQFNDEVGDACQDFDDAYYQEPALASQWVQRTWSNVSAKAGHNPCVPAPAGAYFNTAPLGLDSIMVTDINNMPLSTKGYAIKVGQKRTVQIGFYSDAPIGPWDIQVVEGDGINAPMAPTLTIAATGTSGSNGNIASVDITSNSAAPPSGTLVTAISTLAGQPTRYQVFLVTN